VSGLRRAFLRVAALFRARALDRDLHDELDSHLALAADDYVRRGMTLEEARRRARMDLGGVDAAHEDHREARSLPTIDSVRKDVAYALRGFVRDPAFTCVAVLILALAIGANTAVFSVVNPLILRALPFRDADELAWIAARGEGLSARTYRAAVFEELRRHNRSFQEISGYFAFFGYFTYKLTGRGESQGLVGVPVAPRFFEVLGVQPAHGRLFLPEEMHSGGPRAAVLTHALWQRRFGADPGLVGQAVTIDGEDVRIVGVLPADFDFGAVFSPGVQVDMFVPARLSEMREWGNILSLVGRLRPGMGIQQAQAELDRLMPQLLRANPEWGSVDAQAVPLKTYVSGPLRRSLVVLWCAVGLVLLIACANLSSLFLARAAARGKEMAVRMALGASRGRLIRQLLTEGVVMGLFGGLVGVPLAFLLTQYLTTRSGLSLPLLHRVHVDGAALVFTAVTAIAAGVVFGMAPAWRVSRGAPQLALQEQARGSTEGPFHRAVRSGLVVAEIALACVLLVGAGLLMRSFLHILDVDLGFAPSRAMAVRVAPANTATPAQRSASLDELVRRVQGVPGVEVAGLTDALPLDRNRTWTVSVPGDVQKADRRPLSFLYVIGPGYLEAMGIPLRAGRGFTGHDTATSQSVMLINETLARRLFPGRDPVGLVALTGNDRPRTIVGVVANVRQSSLEEEPVPQMYLPYAQETHGAPDLILRSSLPPERLMASVRAALATLDPDLLTSELRPIDDLVDRAISPRRFLVTVLGGFSFLALALACLGIYGVVSYTVSQRTQEIGVRMALGASGREVRRQVLESTLRLALLGIGLGTLAAIPVVRVIASLLYGTTPSDPITYAGAVGLLLTVALIAGYVPALRASRIDPMSALRGE
jgi:predicted permease